LRIKLEIFWEIAINCLQIGSSSDEDRSFHAIPSRASIAIQKERQQALKNDTETRERNEARNVGGLFGRAVLAPIVVVKRERRDS